MRMLYNSDQFVVVAFEVPALVTSDGEAAAARGGFEIVDKFARKEIYIEGALAARFQQGVQALTQQGPNEDALDEFIGGFTAMAQQPVLLH
jgi:Protein of unknown function (DUF3567)